MLKASLFIGIGGFLGSISRYLLSQYVDKKIDALFPYGTFSVNILGCLLLGILYGLAEKENLLTTELRLLLTVGFCGSFTTFSTFVYEKLQLLNQGDWMSFTAYTASSIILGILSIVAGTALVRLF